MPDNTQPEQPVAKPSAAQPASSPAAATGADDSAGAPSIDIINTGANTVTPPETSNLETTTAKDGAIPINKEASVAEPAAAPAAPEEPVTITEKDLSAPAAASTETPAPESPESKLPGEAQAEEDLSEQIEVLSGEVQALEAKIDRLTGDVSPSTSTPTVPVAEVPVQKPAAMPSVSPVSPPSSEAAIPVSGTLPEKKPPQPVTDIYNRVAEQQKTADKSGEKEVEATEQYHEEHGSAVGTIGTILIIIGLLVAWIVLVAPLFKEMIGQSLWAMVNTIGWLVALGSMGVGLILAVFSSGRGVIKVMAVVFLVLLSLMYLGVNGYSNYFGPLQSFLEPLFSFYR